MTHDTITKKDAAEMGLSDDEFERIVSRLGRTPNKTELGVFSAMWSEHCSYKSSRKWLKTLPTEGDKVIQGPGENAGVVDIGDGWAVVFKIESHNHPSFIEPYQGAATGVGGILRDVFTMGARPVALLNALRFGAPDNALTRYLLNGVVAGISGYGNCIGIPTVGGEVNFNPSYNGNILVNAMAVGLARADRIFYSAASGVGNPVYYIGAKTGRDGIHGATMASSEFNDESAALRPTVQVGDPLAGKLLLEASLELMEAGAVIAIQDMGAAGLTSSSVEMSSKGNLGMKIDLSSVPVREDNMSAYEIMLSESQERMLVILKPDAAETAQEILAKWDLDCAEIGKVTDKGHLVLYKDDDIVADIPIAPLVDDAPEYDRPHEASPALPEISSDKITGKKKRKPKSIGAVLLELMGSHHLASRRWIWEQYDRHVMADTIAASGGGGAALVRVHGTQKGIAITTDCTPRYVKANPEAGTAQAVAEAYRNITAIGAEPVAITNNLNFGNPETPLIMGQIVGAVAGMAKAADVFKTPVVSGNVSLYNETDGKAIDPAPVIGMVGVIDNVEDAVGIGFRNTGEAIFVIGQDDKVADGWLGCSVYADIMGASTEAAPPPVDCSSEKANGDFLRSLIATKIVNAAQDIADGGLLCALAEMALCGNIGADIDVPADTNKGNSHGWCFGEDQGRYLITTADPDAVIEAAKTAGIAIARIGTTASNRLKLSSDGNSIDLQALRDAYENWLPEYVSRPPAAQKD